MRRGTEVVSVLSVLFVLSLSSCGGGSGGGSSAPSPYTGITTAAVITDNNADEIALAAFQGGDLGANAVIPLAPAGSAAVSQPAAGPTALALVKAVSKTALKAVLPPADGPSPRAPFTESGVIPDGMGGEARYTISGDDATGFFTGTFVFVAFHGDGGGTIAGTVSVSGTVTQNSLHILFDFQSVQVVDMYGGTGVTAVGTVDLTSSLDPASESGTAVLNLFMTDNVTGKAVWLSDYHLTSTAGAGFSDVALSGRIYLHDYGYVDIVTQAPFRYQDGETFPSGGQMTVTGQANRGVRLTADSQTQCTLDADLDGDGLYDELTVTVNW